MKNKMADLNDHLFAQIERLSVDDISAEQLEIEATRGETMVSLADQIIRINLMQVQAAKIASDHGIDPTPYLPKFAPTGTTSLMVVSPPKQARSQ